MFYIILKGSVSVWAAVDVDQMRAPIAKYIKKVKNKANMDSDFLFPKSVIKEHFQLEQGVKDSPKEANDTISSLESLEHMSVES